MTDRPHERRRIEQVVADAERHQNDPEEFCRLLAPDVVLVNVAGTRLIGRDAVRRAMEAALRTPLADVVTKHEVERIAFLRPDVAVMIGTKVVRVRDEGVLTESFRARLTFVLVKDDEWRIAIAQNTPIRGDGARAEQAPRPEERRTRGGDLSDARAVALPGGIGLVPPPPRKD